ncbi:MAG TPA: aldehyde dehydrogenase family protein [Vicinamibacterales bacterium]|nr:aldehyde dehydrogenase family protein [Vicinamibacterales bacterium]
MLHIPLLRFGEPYKSIDVATAAHHRTRKPFVEISQANVGLISRDLLKQHEARAALQRFAAVELIAMCNATAPVFLNDTLPLGDTSQSPQDYLEQLNATTGMPFVMGKRNMARVAAVLENMESILRGLTRGLDLAVLDRGYGEVNGGAVSFFPRAQALGVVLPNNSPGVHGLWLPSIALRTPLVLRPGSAEPWTPYRLIQALIKVGVPREAFCFYPSGHAGAGEIVRSTGRSMFFGDVGAVGTVAGDPRVELHGPGYSKLFIGADRMSSWKDYIDLIAASVVENGGRSCVNASGVWVPSHAKEIADALAERLAKVEPRAADDERAEIAPFVDPAVAARISQQIDAGLYEAGAEDVTAKYRKGDRLVEKNGATYLLPTVVRCDSSQHPLANREFLFPFVSVVQMDEEEAAAVPDCFGPTLVVTALTGDRQTIDRLLSSDLVGRLNLGPIQTNRIVWDQPHEGNLFEHLYGRRAFQRAG